MHELAYVRRRECLRRAFSTDCEAVRLEGFSRVSRRILDLSHRGALLECEGDVRVGDELVLSFEAPKGGSVVDAIAEVRNVAEDGGARRAGVRFTELAWEGRAELFVGLAGIPPRVPARRPLVDYAATVRRIARPG